MLLSIIRAPLTLGLSVLSRLEVPSPRADDVDADVFAAGLEVALGGKGRR